MWSLIVAIVVGFIAGLIARAIHPGDDKAGFIVTALLGCLPPMAAGCSACTVKIQQPALLPRSLAR